MSQSVTPLVVLGGLHLEVITDLAWSPDGKLLAISSYDCYCRCSSLCLCLAAGCSNAPMQDPPTLLASKFARDSNEVH